MRKKVSFTVAAFAVDQDSRTLSGVLIPYDEVSGPAADPTTGKTARYSFSDGTVELPEDPSEVVLNYGHDGTSLYMQVGAAAELTASPEGVQAKFLIARTPEGDRVLALADPEVRVLKSFSAEVDGEFQERNGVMHAKATVLTGAAVVRKPAFKGAHITSVAASAADDQEGTTMKCTKCGAVHADGITTCDPAVLAAAVSFSKADGEKLMTDVQSLSEKIAKFENIKLPVGPGTPQLEVKEEPIYRFAGSEPAPSGFDFATDLLAAGKDGDRAALERIKAFTAAQTVQSGPHFVDQPTTTADVSAINPSQYRPDMFLGQAPTPTSPLYDFFFKGALTSVTPFFWSKLDRTNTDVGVADHVEDTNPESRDLVTAAGATVTPVPVSGRVHITREVADQGGNPVVSGLVWSEYERSFAIARETKTAALINAAAVTELGGAIAAGATGAVAGAAVQSGLVGLQFLADGFRFQRAFGHIDLYTALAAALDGNDRPLYPILNPQNASGAAASKYATLDIAGWSMYPAASLGATDVNQKSYVADPSAVHIWASGLQRLDKLSETVAGWDMSVFAYFAGVVYDVTGLRKITYDKSA